MKKSSFDAIVRALHDARVPFLVVGGIAVIHHGYGRVTQDVDLVIRLEKETIVRAFLALAATGYRPALPITAEQFADPTTRDIWKREKGMKVLQFWSDVHRDTPLNAEMAGAAVRDSLPGLPVRIVSLETLLKMKRETGRPQDVADIDELNLLHGKDSSYDRET